MNVMPRFFTSQPKIEKGVLRIEGKEVKHIRNVLRLKVGDEISVFNGSAKEYQGVIVEEISTTFDPIPMILGLFL